MLDTVFVDIRFFEGVFVPVTVVEVMGVEARVLEWTVAMASVEMLAWYLVQSLLI